MKKKVISIYLIAIFFIVALIYFNSRNFEGDLIRVEKQSSTIGTYEYYCEINDPLKIKEMKDILNRIYWSSSKVEMAYPPDYHFYFVYSSNKEKSEDNMVNLWISPNRNKVELIFDSKYIQLNEVNSDKLFQIITREQLK